MKPIKMQVIKAQEGYNEVGQVIEVLYTTGSMSKCYNSNTGFHYLTRSENLQPVQEVETYELNPRFDSRKSFYGKARINVIGRKTILTSYTTEVAYIEDGKAVVNGDYSPTTLRHIKEFLLQNGFKAESKAQILTDYTQYKWMDIQDESNFHTGTLAEVKDWLEDFWRWEDIDEEDELSDAVKFEKFIDKIRKAKTEAKVNDFLEGIGWYMEQI